jgi:ppGpp synthetase/RelA/SpoT-type nucleotidyltranferase
MMNVDLPTWLAAQVKTYAEQERPIYCNYADFIKDFLRQACNAIAPEASVESRAKTVLSFAEKAVRKHQKYDDPVHQLTDLCGARVITDTQEEVERVCQFIRTNFKVDDANSDDKAILLGASQFGYRSVHFVVQLSDSGSNFKDAHKTIEQRKAEIQVRTGLQNAWARLAHDRIYKSQFKVPDPIQREMNRASALLEEVDRDFSVILDSLERYSTSQASFSTRAEVENEIRMLRMIAEHVDDRNESRHLALRIASAAKSLSDWEGIVSALEPFANDQDAVVLRELGAAACWKNHKDIDSPGFRNGVLRLEQAVEQDPDDAAGHACLGWSLEPTDEQSAREHYSRAYQLKPNNPYYLMTYLEFQIAVQRQLGGLPLLGPALEAAVETCRKHASAGIELPRAQFTEAKLLLLLKQPYAALAACARGVYIVASGGPSTSENTLQNELRSIRRLAPVKDTIPGHRWLEQLLLLAIAARSDDTVARNATALSKKKPAFTQPIVVVTGGSELNIVSDQEAGYLRLALDSFTGTVICGALYAGTSEVIGSMVKPNATFRSVGYHPQLLPAGMQLDKRHSALVQTEGTNFSPEEALQMWSDLLAQGNRPKEIRLLGLGGGVLSSLEYQLALALGAEVGVVSESGGAADDLRKDPFWSRAGNLRVLPSDRMTIKVFVPPMEKLKVEWLEAAARGVHEKYRQDNKHKVVDPSMAPWEELSDTLKDSNRFQISYATEVLRFAGFGVRPAQGIENTSMSFSKDEVELMGEMEHGRWNVERLRAGWKIGPRDPANKRTPYLVPWSELPEDIRQWDRDAIIHIPDVLKTAGLEIYRLPK